MIRNRQSQKRDIIKSLVDDGLTNKQIAEQIGAHPNYVSCVRQAEKLEALLEWEDVTKWVKAVSRMRGLDLSKIRITRKWR